MQIKKSKNRKNKTYNARLDELDCSYCGEKLAPKFKHIAGDSTSYTCSKCGCKKEVLWIESTINCPYCKKKIKIIHPKGTQPYHPHHKDGKIDLDEALLTCLLHKKKIHIFFKPFMELYQPKYTHPFIKFVDILFIRFGSFSRKGKHFLGLADYQFRYLLTVIIIILLFTFLSILLTYAGTLIDNELPDILSFILSVFLVLIAFLIGYVILINIRDVISRFENKFFHENDKNLVLQAYSLMNRVDIFLLLFLMVLIVTVIFGSENLSHWFVNALAWSFGAAIVAFFLQIIIGHLILLLIIAGVSKRLPRLFGSLLELESDISRLIKISYGTLTCTMLLGVLTLFLFLIWPTEWDIISLILFGLSFLIIFIISYTFIIRHLVNKIYEREIMEIRIKAPKINGLINIKEIEKIKNFEEFLQTIRYHLLYDLDTIVKISIPLSISIISISVQVYWVFTN